MRGVACSLSPSSPTRLMRGVWRAHCRPRRLAGDAAPSTPIHQLTLTYDFEVPKGDGDDKALKVQPIVQGLHSQLYDSPLDSQARVIPLSSPLPPRITHTPYITDSTWHHASFLYAINHAARLPGSQLWRLDDANGAALAFGGAIHDAKPVALKVIAPLTHADAARDSEFLTPQSTPTPH